MNKSEEFSNAILGLNSELHRAVKTKDHKAIEDLLNDGADPNARDEYGCTPLHWATLTNNFPDVLGVINLLLKGGADPKAKDKGDKTPLHLTARNSNPAIIKDLLEAGADIKARDKEGGYIPLHGAARFTKNPGVIEALLEGDKAKTSTNARTNDGWTPLHVAAKYNKNPEVIQTLLNSGSDINARSFLEEITPLHEAARYNKNPAIVTVLLKAEANPKAQDKYGKTPLHDAVHNQNPAIIAALLQAGADPTAKDKANKTPWDYAKDNEALKNSEPYWRLKNRL